MAKTWRQKLAGAGPAHVEVLDKACWGLPIGARLFIATPVMIQERLEAIPFGQTQKPSHSVRLRPSRPCEPS